MKSLGQPLLLKTGFRVLICWWNISIFEQRLNPPIYNKVSIKLHLQDLEIKLSKLLKKTTKCRYCINLDDKFVVLTADFNV